MNIAEAKELIAELAPMLEAGTIEDIEHHIKLLSEAATMVAASLHCAELLNESHVEGGMPRSVLMGHVVGDVMRLQSELDTLDSAVRAVLNDPGSMYPLDREVVVELIALVES